MARDSLAGFVTLIVIGFHSFGYVYSVIHLTVYVFFVHCRLAETKTRSRTCLVHEQCQIEYFCKEDNEAICSRCVIVGDHKGHDVQTMEDKVRRIIEILFIQFTF